MMDTLRYIEKTENIFNNNNNFNTKWIIIKEVSNNSYIRRKRKGQHDIKLWSPNELLMKMPSYRAFRIYTSKYLFRKNNPGSLFLKAINFLSPTYTIVLKRR